MFFVSIFHPDFQRVVTCTFATEEAARECAALYCSGQFTAVVLFHPQCAFISSWDDNTNTFTLDIDSLGIVGLVEALHSPSWFHLDVIHRAAKECAG